MDCAVRRKKAKGIDAAFTSGLSKRWFGQPVAQTHPHLIQTGEVTPGISKDEYCQRRHSFMQKVFHASPGPDFRHLVIIPSATKTYMTHDIPYIFRQNTDFLYLCGFQEPDSILVLDSNGTSGYSSILFVPRKDKHKELWEGPRSGKEGALELTGVDYAEETEQFSNYLNSVKMDNSSVTWYNRSKPTHEAFHNQYMTQHFYKHPGTIVENPTPLLQSLRVIKSKAEIDIMTESNRIASEAFQDTMSFSHPGVNEAHLFAKMDFECRMRGAEFLGYPPVVAGGNRANTIHYINNNQVVAGGDMVLMDAGCEYHGYNSDITRTWPVSGGYTDPQLSLYQAVLEVQDWCIQKCLPRSISLNQLLLDMLTKLGSLLKQLGVVSKWTTGSALRQKSLEFCPHHVGHYLGMDVHDTDLVSRSIPLQAGMVLTVEPGIYIPSHRTDVPAEFRGQGVRIEDNILITETGYHNLTQHCPKDPVVIEELVKSGVRS